MIKRSLYFLVLFITLYANAFAQAKIIFDTDFGGDADDLGALAMLHHFVDRGECKLKAIMCWSTEEYAIPAIDAVNRYYKHPDIPIGVRKDDVYYSEWNYSKPIADSLPHEFSYEDVPDATLLYRKILADSENKSITIVTVGPLMNIQNLIKSEGDSISELTGKELITQKVKEFVIMGGQFPEGEKEWNFDGSMPGVTQFVLENIDVPITFSGYEIGAAIKAGKVFNDIDKSSPLYVGFKHFSEHAPWMKDNYEGEILDNACYDQTAVLYAVRKGEFIYWDRIDNGFCLPDESGGNVWIKGGSKDHAYLELVEDPEEMARLIEKLMLGKF